MIGIAPIPRRSAWKSLRTKLDFWKQAVQLMTSSRLAFLTWQVLIGSEYVAYSRQVEEILQKVL